LTDLFAKRELRDDPAELHRRRLNALRDGARGVALRDLHRSDGTTAKHTHQQDCNAGRYCATMVHERFPPAVMISAR
jgi:hypothetical protein